MKRYFLFLLHFFFTIAPLTAQIDLKIPDWVNKIEPKPVSINKKDVVDGYYYALIDEQYNSIAKQYYFHYAQAIVNEEALTTISQIEFSYDPTFQKPKLHFIKIIRGTTIIDKTKNLDFKILNEESQRKVGLLDGRKTFYTNLSDVRKGDIIEYAYSIDGKNPIMGNYFNYNLQLGYSVPIGQIYYRILFPSQTIPKMLSKNTTVKPVIKTATFTDYIWDIVNPPLIKIDPYTPSWYDPYPTVQISNLKDWNEVKAHGRSLMKLPNYDKTLLQYTVDSIKKSNSTVISQISTLVDFVQKHIRYSGNESGIYSHVPRTPDIILKNRFGDCKEKSVLLNELLRLIHIDANPVFINTILRGKTAEQLPAISAFDHCISSFTFENKLYFIDPTISYQSGNFKLRILPSYGTGMIVDENPEPFTIIPIDSSGSNTTIIEEFDEVDSLDTKLKVTSTFTGTNADDTRYYFHSNSLNSIQEFYKKFYSKYGEQIQVLDTITFTDKSETNEIITVEHYLIKRFWAVNDSSGEKILKRDFMPYSLNYRLVYGDEVTRKDPLQLDFPLNFSQTLIINHKAGWNIDNDAKREQNNFFDYSYNTQVNGNTLN